MCREREEEGKDISGTSGLPSSGRFIYWKTGNGVTRITIQNWGMWTLAQFFSTVEKECEMMGQVIHQEMDHQEMCQFFNELELFLKVYDLIGLKF
ncbi:E3 Ubiquitin-Protein Ligase Hecw1 [Manis pentadactyla]|nr:E3 Ubiquitin-Protein Ligase Hecw1 [Manis pentadactyla]